MSHFVKVHVQGLDYKGRLACYQLLLELLQVRFEGLRLLLCFCWVQCKRLNSNDLCLCWCVMDSCVDWQGGSREGCLGGRRSVQSLCC